MGLFNSLKGAVIGGALGGGAGAVLGGSKKARQAIGLEQSDKEQQAHEAAKQEWENIRSIGQRRNEVSQQRNQLLGKVQEQQKAIEEGEPLRKEKLMQREADIARRDLASRLSGVKSQAQSRGLLYSGLAQKAAQDQALENAQMLGERQQDVAEKSRGLLQGLEDASLQDALDRASLQQGEELAGLGQMEMDWRRQYAEQQARSKGMSEIGGGIGGLVGTYAGSQSGKGKS